MNLKALFLGFAIGIFSIGQAQSLSVNETEIELNKEAAKAMKKDQFINAGSFWNEDGSQVHMVFFFKPKNEAWQQQVVTLSQYGEVLKSEVAPFSETSLNAYNLRVFGDLSEAETPKGDLSGVKVGYFKRPTLAGTPELKIGTLEDNYYNDLWSGYSFDEEEEFDLDVRFWPFFSYALDEDHRNKDDYRLQKRTMLGKALQGERTYIPMDDKAIIGGLKAVGSANVYFSGLYDLQNKKWLHQEENELFEGIIGRSMGNMRLKNGNVAELISNGDKLMLLNFDKKGHLVNHVEFTLQLEKNSISSEFFTLMETDNGDLLIASGQPEKRGKKCSVQMAIIRNGNLLLTRSLPFEQLEQQLIVAPKNKFDFEDIPAIAFDNVMEFNGMLLLTAHSHSWGASNLVFVFNKDWQFQRVYQMDPPINQEPSGAIVAGSPGTEVPPILMPDGKGNLYWIARTIPEELKKGVHAARDVTDAGSIRITTITTTRIDNTITVGKVSRFNPSGGEMEKPISLEDYLLFGARPMEVNSSGGLVINAVTTKSAPTMVFIH